MNAPPVAIEVITDLVPGRHVHAREPEDLTAWRLKVEPHGLAIEAPPLMAVDLHVHRALVHQTHLAAVGANGPRAIEFMPGSLVAIEEQIRIDRIELHVVQISVLKSGLERRARLEIREDEGLEPGIESARRQTVFFRHRILLIGSEIFHALAWKHAQELPPGLAVGRFGILAFGVDGVAIPGEGQPLVRIAHPATEFPLTRLLRVD